MSHRIFLIALVLTLAAARAAGACEVDGQSIFSCEAAHGRKFIELCGSSPLTGEHAYLQYRFGSLDGSGDEAKVELEFPAERAGSQKRFFGATYTHEGVYTQSVRFVSAGFDYTVFTRAKGTRELGAGVEVRNRGTGKTVTIDCSERPRFYIFDLKGLVACDPATPVGTACIK